MTGRPYDVSVATTAERTLARLPKSAAAAIVEFAFGPLCETPQRGGT